MKIKYILLGWIFLASSCNYLEVTPKGKVIPSSLSELRAMMNSAYSKYPSVLRLLTMRSDEGIPNPNGLVFSNYKDIAIWNDKGKDAATFEFPYTQFYNIIFYCNDVIEKAGEAEKDSPNETREQLKGEALLMRAYTYFTLLNLYTRPYIPGQNGKEKGIPLALKIDIGQEFERQSIEAVYEQILNDISLGSSLLQIETQPAATRYRFSKASAKALEIRVRLFKCEWKEVVELTKELLPTLRLENLNAAEHILPFRFDSQESLLALETGGQDFVNGEISVNPSFAELYNTEKHDTIYNDRRANTYIAASWAGLFPNKGMKKEERCGLRASEVWLSAAEAYARTEDISGAKKLLKDFLKNRLSRYYLPVISTEIDNMNKTGLIRAILDERGRELAFEGMRWFDLRRTERPALAKTFTDSEFNEIKGELQKDDPRYTLPFPKEAVTANPHLVD